METEKEKTAIIAYLFPCRNMLGQLHFGEVSFAYSFE